MKRARGAPLLLQILLVLILAMLAAEIANVAVVLTAPAPGSRTHDVAAVARALSGVADGRFDLEIVAAAPQDNFEDPDEQAFRATLARTLGTTVDNVRVVMRAGPGLPQPGDIHALSPPPGPRVQTPFGTIDNAGLAAALRLADGRWRMVRQRPEGVLQEWQKRALLWLLASLLLVGPLGYWAARRMTAPIRGFAQAAERLGRDPTAPPLALRGPAEIRLAAASFNDMQERLRRYVEDRTAMIGAIAHDLRTPLTRLAFRLEGAPDALREKAARDIAEMEQMIAATLDFVRDATATPERAALDLNALVESAADDLADTGKQARAEPGERLVTHGDAPALRRMIDNLLANAVTYGGTAVARVYRDGASAIIEVDDEGPGLPPEELTRAFEPFRRGEGSRSRETGGIGLGLAVVRTIVHAHGGKVALVNLPGGGLRAWVELPL